MARIKTRLNNHVNGEMKSILDTFFYKPSSSKSRTCKECYMFKKECEENGVNGEQNASSLPCFVEEE